MLFLVVVFENDSKEWFRMSYDDIICLRRIFEFEFVRSQVADVYFSVCDQTLKSFHVSFFSPSDIRNGIIDAFLFVI